MLNERGWSSGQRSWDVLFGPPNVRRAYASEELIEHLKRYPLTDRKQFEHEWLMSHLGGAE